MPIYLEYLGYCVEVPSGNTVIGRDVRCALRFNDSSVSRRHAQFIRAGDQVELEDVGSTNGTLLNGELIAGRVKVNDRDRIELGGYVLKLLVVDDQEDQQSTRRIASLSDLGSLRNRASATTTPPRPGSSRTRGLTLAPEDRRRHERRAMELNLVYTSSELEIEATTRDLSMSGVFVCTTVLDPLGTQCDLTLLIDGGPPLQLRGIVRRVVEREDAGREPVGLGIEFVNVGEPQQKWLELAVQRMDETRPVHMPDPT